MHTGQWIFVQTLPKAQNIHKSNMLRTIASACILLLGGVSQVSGYIQASNSDTGVGTATTQAAEATASSAPGVNTQPSVSSKGEPAQAGHTVKLTWTASVPTTKLPRDVITGYNVYRSKKPNVKCTVQNKIASLTEPATSYVDTQVESGRNYYYATTAVSANQKESGCSKEVKVVVPKR